MLFDKSVLGAELQRLFQFFINSNRMQFFIENWWKLPGFLTIAALKRPLNSCWEVLNGFGKRLENVWSYLLAFGQFWKAIRKLLRNTQIKLILAGQTFLLTVRDKKKNLGNEAVCQRETKQNCPVAIGKNMAIPSIFCEAPNFCVEFDICT